MRKKLIDALREGVLILDGAMGTELIARGLGGQCSEYLNITNPDIIIDIHSAYCNAGADAILTNTFGANSLSLARHGHSDKVREINLSACKNARKAAGDSKYVLGDIGQTGEFLKPLGTLEPQQLKQIFAEQASALAEGGVDGFVIETFAAVDEAQIALEAVRLVSDLPAFVSFAFDPAGNDARTMMGVDAAAIVSAFADSGATGVGFNCGTVDMEGYVKLARQFKNLCANTNLLLIAEPNAGRPELVDGRAVYSLSPEDFTESVQKIIALGFNLVGGCCGTGPAHISAISRNKPRE